MAKSPLLPGETPGEYLARISSAGTIIAASREVRKKRQRKPRASRGFQHSQPKVTAAQEIEKPSFETAVAAKGGDKEAQRHVNLWIKSQRAKQQSKRTVEALTDRALFGQAEGAIKSAAKTVNPVAGAVIESLSPSTAIKEAASSLREGDIGPAAVSALGILPAGRGTVAAARAARVARAEARGFQHAVKGAEKAAKASAKFEKNVRSVKVGSKDVQLPGQARSRVTRYGIEKPADIASRAIGKRRIPLLHAGSEERGFKHAGRETHREAERAQVAMIPHVKALPKEGSKKDVAHFWWAQLPPNLRNAKGLRAVRDMQAEELQRVVNGERLAELQRARAAIKADLKATNDPSLLGDLERAQDLIDDLPNVQDDIARSIARLDKIIAKPPELDPRVIEAVSELSGTRRGLLEGVGLLKPETAAGREGLLSRSLGVEPSGEEIFVGHRLARPRGANPALVPVSPGLGKAKAPQGVRQKNRAILIRQGQVRESTHVAAQDWQAAETYRSAIKARNDLFEMGEPFTGRVPQGYSLVNKKGRAVPASWKTDKLAQMVAEGESEEEILKAADEIVSGFLAEGDEAAKALIKATGAKAKDLRIVRNDLVKRYYSQFQPYRGSKAWKPYDMAIDAVMANLIFARLGYIPKNAVQNLVMAVPHQGVFFLANLPRAAQVLADPQLRRLLAVEVGQGASGAVATEAATKALRAPAHAVTGVADTPFRISALLHELAAAGVISKYNPVLTPTDKAALIAAATDPANRKLLNAASARATDAMADFGRMTPTQRRIARRFLIIPGWLMAGSRYPAHFAATHPGRSAAMAYVAAGEPGAPEQYQVNKPINEYFADWTPSWLEGIPTPWGFERTASINPVSTAPQMAKALAARSPETAIDYANPVPLGIIDTLRRVVETPEGGSRRVGYGEAAQRNLLERLIPNYPFARDMISPPSGEDRIYSDTSRLGRLRREAGILPIEIDRQAARRSKLIESGSKADKAEFNLKATYRATLQDLARVGYKLTPDEKRDVRRAFTLSTALAKASAGKEKPSDKIRAAMEVDRKYHLFSAQDRKDVQAFLKTSTEAMNESLWRKIQGIYGGDVRARVSEALSGLRAEKRLEPTEVRGIR